MRHVRIRALAGHKITQAADVPILDRFFAVTVCVGRGDSPDNYKQIPDDEVEELKKQQAAAEVERQKQLGATYFED